MLHTSSRKGNLNFYCNKDLIYVVSVPYIYPPEYALKLHYRNWEIPTLV